MDSYPAYRVDRSGILFLGAGLSVVWPSLVVLLLIGSAFFLIALNRFRRSISQMV